MKPRALFSETALGQNVDRLLKYQSTSYKMTLSTPNSIPQPSDSSTGANSSDSHIRDVWAFNLDEEMDRIRDIADSYPYIVMVCVFKFSRLTVHV